MIPPRGVADSAVRFTSSRLFGSYRLQTGRQGQRPVHPA